MKELIFKSKNDQEKEFSQELRKRVRAYFKEKNISMQGDFRMFAKTVIILGLYLAPFVVILTVPMSSWAALGMTVIIGIGVAGVGMSIMHDATHGAYSSKSLVNKIAASTMFLLGNNTINWKIQHNVNHHTFTNIYQYDPDISTKAVIRLCDHAPLKRYHRFQQYYAFPLYGLMTIMKFFADIFDLVQNNKAGTTKEMGANPTLELVKLIFTKIIYLAIVISLPLIFTDFSIWQIALGFAVMHFTAGMIMSTVFQMAHVVEGAYQPLPTGDFIESDWIVHQLRSTSDFGKRNGLLSWYIGGLDFQVEHHLFPTICHVHYSAIAPIVEQTAKEYGLEYNTNRTFAHALVSHYKRLKELGVKKSVELSRGT